MLQFAKLELSDIDVVRRLLINAPSRISDYTIGGIFMWRDYMCTEIAVDGESLFFKVKYTRGETAFTIPIGERGHSQENIDKLREYCAVSGETLRFCTVPAEGLEMLYKHCDITSVVGERAWYDYLYLSEDLRGLLGRKYSGQRNHINKFKRLYPDYSFCELDSSNLARARAFVDGIFQNGEELDPLADEERRKVYEVFDNFEAYGLFGGMVTVGEQVAAISVGEAIKDTLFVHIEKADKQFAGSYQIMVNEFAKHFAADLIYINREDDVGDEGLRTSKLSYHPTALLEKSTVEIGL